MKVFVTGDAGFIGYHVSRKFLERGHTVLGIDAMTDYYDRQLKLDRLSALSVYGSFQHKSCRLEDASMLNSIVSDFAPELVIHLAAQAGVRYSLENPEAYISSNVVGTYTLLEVLREFKPAHVMIASTSSAYGGNVSLPFTETQATQAPSSLYAATKIASEAIAHSYSHLWKIPTTCFRFFTVYGEWGRPDMAIFKFVRAIEAEDPIDVYGGGRMYRDFTYVGDLVDAIELLAKSQPHVGEPVSDIDTLSPTAPFRILNIGGGSPTELNEFIAAIETATGKKADRRLLGMQAGDIRATHADTRLLRQLIGTAPSTDIQTGVGRFVDWYRAYFSGRQAQ